LGNFPILGFAMPLFVGAGTGAGAGAVEAVVAFAGTAGVEAEGAVDFL
jgi:hypothetical protein